MNKLVLVRFACMATGFICCVLLGVIIVQQIGIAGLAFAPWLLVAPVSIDVLIWGGWE